MGKLFSRVAHALCIISCTFGYCTLITSQFSIPINTHNTHDIQELLLDMWSQLDLMQAITITPEQQELFTHALACQALDLYATVAPQIPQEDMLIVREYHNLCTTLRTTSDQVLSSVTTSARHALLFVLDTLINQLVSKLDVLKAPGNITGERSPQQISLKDIFTS